MSLNELAVDLTCIPAEFAPARTPKDLTEQEPEEAQMPGYAHFPTQTASRSRPKPNSRGRVKAVQEEKHDGPIYHVHGGMLRMSKLMGGHDKPVHSAVRDALRKHRGYGETS
jgi:sn1-specific diacylglycerol lipase